MARYGEKAQKKVEKVLHEYKRGQAHSGKGHAKVMSRKQAIAIALSKARKEGAKVPRKRS
jgi:exonuclease VII small subunit